MIHVSHDQQFANVDVTLHPTPSLRLRSASGDSQTLHNIVASTAGLCSRMSVLATELRLWTAMYRIFLLGGKIISIEGKRRTGFQLDHPSDLLLLAPIAILNNEQRRIASAHRHSETVAQVTPAHLRKAVRCMEDPLLQPQRLSWG